MTIKEQNLIDENNLRIINIEKEMRILNDINEGYQKLILNNQVNSDEKLILEDKMYDNLVKYSNILTEKNLCIQNIANIRNQ